MKFTLIAVINNKMSGVDLDDEYDRLGFEKRPASFPDKQITFEVSKEFVKEHRDIFGSSASVVVVVDSKDTDAEDWEDWGSAGSMLSQENFNIDKVMRVKKS